MTIPVRYLEQEWRSLDDGLIDDDTVSLSPSGKDIWLYTPSDRIEQMPRICHYMNWSGWRSDLAKLKAEGYTFWCSVQRPLLPTRAA